MWSKAANGVLIIILLLNMLIFAFNIQVTKAATTIIVPDDFPTVQAAINSASQGDTVYVRAGTYPENLVVNKSISLIGEDCRSIIDGRRRKETVFVGADNVTIRGFTITNGSSYGYSYPSYIPSGVRIKANHVTVESNNISANLAGVSLYRFLADNVISGNNITASTFGIFLYGSKCKIYGNTIRNNQWGIYLLMGSKSAIHANNITNNKNGVRFEFGTDNTIYHNNFINNALQAETVSSYRNIWDDGYPSGGNYWSDYKGADSCHGLYQNQPGGDGIGDTPYVIDGANQDRYPLVRYEHELVVSLESPLNLEPYESVLLNATVSNSGIYDETNVELQLLVNGVVANSSLLIEVKAKSSKQISYLWTPTEIGTYNVTAYASPVANETFTSNNIATKIVKVCPTATIYLRPTGNSVIVGGNFSISIFIADATDLYGWQIQLDYFPSMLNLTEAIYPQGHVFEGRNFLECRASQHNATISVENDTLVDLATPLNTTWIWRPRILNLTDWFDNDKSGTLTVSDIVWFESIPQHDTYHWFRIKKIETSESSAESDPGVRIKLILEYAYVAFGAVLIGAEKGFTGSGILAQLTFTGIDLGESILNFSRQLGEDTLLLDSELMQIPITATDGNVKVWRLLGDLNGDRKVDIRDIAQASLAFGSYPNHPRWNPAADANTDSKVDIKDIALIAKNFGQTSP